MALSLVTKAVEVSYLVILKLSGLYYLVEIALLPSEDLAGKVITPHDLASDIAPFEVGGLASNYAACQTVFGSVEVLAKMPLNATGKVDRTALKRMAQERVARRKTPP